MTKKLLWLVVGLSSQFMACTEGSLDINLDPNPQIDETAYMIDTMRIDAYTIKGDSLNSSASGEILAGSVDLSDLIHIDAEAYFQLSLPLVSYGYYNITESIVIDSAKVIFPHAGFVGDTTYSQRFLLNELQEEVSTSDQQTIDDAYTYNLTPLAETVKKLRPSKDTTLELTIDPNLAQQILTYYQTSDKDENPDLKKVLKGLVLRGDKSNTAISRFDASNTKLRLYTHTAKTFEKYNFDFPVVVNNAQFTHYATSSNYSGFSKLVNPGDQLSTAESSNSMLLMNAIGYSGKVVIPGIAALKEVTDLASIYKCTLVLYSTRKGKNETPQPPSTLGLYSINLNNETESVLTDNSAVQITGSYTYDPEGLVFNSYYTFDLTNYLIDILYGDAKNKGFQIAPIDGTDGITSLKGVGLADYEHSGFKAQLRVYYNK